jgi:DNA-binding CsgD family transcriptional regulator
MKINLDQLGKVVRDVGSARFGQAFFRLFNSTFDAKVCVVFAFPTASTPHPIVLEGLAPEDSELARKLAHEYVNGAYRDDPNVCSRNVARVPAVYCVRATELADTRFRRHFYEQPRIGYELVQLSSVDNVLYYLNFCRDERMGPFKGKDVIAMRKLSRFAIPALHRHTALWMESNGQPLAPAAAKPCSGLKTAATLNHMREVFLDAPQGLSRREAEVCAGTVLGYTTVAIGLNLQIAPNTVATHRKRAYKKLGVCSQSDLFARYFETVRLVDHAA